MSSEAAPSNALISLQQVTMQFGTQRVLHAIDLEIFRGQTLAVIGESGCGKTVLLKLIIGLLRPTVGRVVFDGTAPGKSARARADAATAALRLSVPGRRPVRQPVGLRQRRLRAARQGRTAEAEVREVVRQRLQEVGLPPNVVTKKPAELSGGMKKRVGLARALALEPEVMLYDEPTTGLDPIMTDVINELILQTRRQHPVTSIVVTHEMKTVNKVADRVVMFYPLSRLQPGEHQILFDGTPEQLRECPDPRVRQFIEGEARDRLQELAQSIRLAATRSGAQAVPRSAARRGQTRYA